jgi:hypothetical protein
MMKAALPKTALVLLTALTFALAVSAQGGSSNPSKDERPAAVAAVAPYYTTIAFAARLTTKWGKGKTVVNVKIDNSGTVTSAEAPDAHPLVAAACVAAAKRWRFETVGGAARVRTASLTFILDERDDEPESSADGHDLIIFRPPYTVEVRRFAPVIYTTGN